MRGAAAAAASATVCLGGTATGSSVELAVGAGLTAYVAYKAMPVKDAPAMILPSVTGRRFQKRICLTEMAAPSIIPDGKTYMLTTECSNPSAKKVMIGSHIAAIFPTVDRE